MSSKMTYTTALAMALITTAISSNFVTPFSSTLQADNKTDKQAYFAHLMFRESPYSKYKGTYELSKEQASKRAHYRFSYDKQGRVIEVAHQIGDTIIADNGNWDTFIWYGPKTTISYESGQEIHQFYNIDNEPSISHGNVFKAVFEMDKKGNRESLAFFDEQNNPVNSQWGIQNYQWATDSEQRISEKRFNIKNEQVSIRPQFEFYEVRLKFDDSGKLSFVYNYGLESKPTNNDSGAGMDRIVYDKDNNFIRWQVYNKDGLAVEGNSPNVHLGEHLYDTEGNKIALRGFDRSGHQITFRWGFHEMANGYDSFGNLTSVQALNEDGSQQFWIETDFNEAGVRKLLTKGLDEQGNLAANRRFRGAAAIRHNYEGDSNISTGFTRLDKDLQPITAETNAQ